MGNSPPTAAASNEEPSQEKKKIPEKKRVGDFPTTLDGEEGLAELGFETRLVPCSDHVETTTSTEPFWACQTRVFHSATNTMITADNQTELIPNGPFFEAVASKVQQICQDTILVQNYGLQKVTLSEEPSIQALVSQPLDDDNNTTPTFLFITGKGISRCGIVSAMQTLTEGLEKGSVLYHFLEARKRGWNAIFLDPNAQGVHKGMETVTLSLQRLFASGKIPQLYVLLHSAAGGYFVRYLLQHDHLQQSLKAVVFTDSTHRIAWAQKANPNKNPQLAPFLESSCCLYIRNNALGNEYGSKMDMGMGKPADTDIWWKQRFGNLQTVWAGTSCHSSMCWVARSVIWGFMDQQLNANDSTANTPNENNAT